MKDGVEQTSISGEEKKVGGNGKPRKKNLWRRATCILAAFSILMTVSTGYFFVQSGYYSRVMNKLGVGGYNPSGREYYLTQGWAQSLEDFTADVVFLGDSITRGGEWADYFPDLTVCKLAVGGESIEQILYRVDMVETLQPEKVFLLAGVNNVSRLGYEDTIREQYAKLLQALDDIGCEVYVQSILPVTDDTDVSNDHIRSANAIIEELAEEYGVADFLSCP